MSNHSIADRDNVPAELVSRQSEKARKRHSITIGKPPLEVYNFWRDFKNLAGFMKDIKEIEVTSHLRSRWVVQLKSGLQIDWDAEVIRDEPGKRISWQSLEGSGVKTRGEVLFEKAPANSGTIVRLSMIFEIPGGALTELAAKLIGEDPDSVTQTNLKRFKALLETGEIPTVEGQPNGKDEKTKDNKINPQTSPAYH